MRAVILFLSGILLAEAASWWWMSPSPLGADNPVLTLRLPFAPEDFKTQDPRLEDTTAANPPSDIRPFAYTPLPDIYAEAAPILRCSSGQVLLATSKSGPSLHLAFFEWSDTDTGGTLEAFRHAPEACMGSLGLTLTSRQAPRPFQVDNQTLLFEHSVFRDSASPRPIHGRSSPPAVALPQSSNTVHAFRAVWVAGIDTPESGQSILGVPFDQLRTLRLRCARHRFRPAHARVVQGAVRGAATPDLAWQAFHQAMLVHLKMEAASGKQEAESRKLKAES